MRGKLNTWALTRTNGGGGGGCRSLRMGTAPSMAEGMAGIELASEAEQATTTRPEALEPGAYGEVKGSAFDVTRTCGIGYDV